MDWMFCKMNFLCLHIFSSVKLNGQVLQMSGPDLPPLEPWTVTGDVTVEQQSFGFIVVPKADVKKCVDYFLSLGTHGKSL